MNTAALLAALYYLLLALCLFGQRLPRVASHRHLPIARELAPLLSVVVGVLCAGELFDAVSGLTPAFFPHALAGALSLTLPAAAFRGRARRIAAGVTLLVIALLATADALYYRFFSGIVPFLGSSTIKQVWDVMGSVVALLAPRDLAFLPLFVAAVFLVATPPAPVPDGARLLARRAFAIALGVSLVAALFVVVDVELWLGRRVAKRVFSWKQRVGETGLFVAHARDLGRNLRDLRAASEPPTPERLVAIERYLEGRIAPRDELFGRLRGKNLIVIQVEAMQQWVVGARANGAEITPFLNRLKNERALYFSGVWDLTAISPTADCEYLAMNSQHPLANAAVVFKYADNHFVALPGVFAASGYDTVAMHAFERGFWNRARVYPTYGFRRMMFDHELGDGERFGWGLSDKAFFAKALTRLDAAKKPVYGLLITLTSHHPYSYLPAKEHRIGTKGLPKMLADYVASMHYVDEALSQFFSALEQRGYAKDTVVAVYGDHESRITLDREGEAAASKGLSLDPKTVADLARRSFSTRKVPFFVVPPAPSTPQTLDRVGGQIDFAPTLLHLFGFEKPKSMLGRTLTESGGSVVRFDGAGVDQAHVRLADGSCRTRAGVAVPTADCSPIARRADEEVQISWTITEHDLAAKLSGVHPALGQAY